MNTADYTTFKEKIVEAHKAQSRVRKMYRQNENYDIGALYAYLFEYISAVGFRSPALSSSFLSRNAFETWLDDLDKWFFTIADLYFVALPEEE